MYIERHRQGRGRNRMGTGRVLMGVYVLEADQIRNVTLPHTLSCGIEELDRAYLL